MTHPNLSLRICWWTRINETRKTGRKICCQDMLNTYYTFKRYLSVARLTFVLQNFIKLALGDVLL